MGLPVVAVIEEIDRNEISLAQRPLLHICSASAVAPYEWPGRIDDGKIFILPVEETLRIRTGERGPDAV